MKRIRGAPDMGKPLEEDDINEFLGSKLNLQLATVDGGGEPVIQPVWYVHDRENDNIYIETAKLSKKVANMRKKPTVYFCVAEESAPYRCVKGKADARISEDISTNMPIVEKLCLKYLGGLDTPFSKTLLDTAKSGASVVIQLTPRYYTTWSFG